MRIIAKHRDFYDYYGHVIGADPRGSLLYDRRSVHEFADNFSFLEWVCDPDRESWKRPDYVPSPEGYEFLLEAGYTQFFLRAVNVKRNQKKTKAATGVPPQEIDYIFTGDLVLEHTRNENRHVYQAPLTLAHYRREDYWYFSWRRKKRPPPLGAIKWKDIRFYARHSLTGRHRPD